MKKDFFKPLLLTIGVAVLVATVRPAMGADAADTAWQSLTNFSLSPPPMTWATNPPTQAEINKFDDRRAAESESLADKAHDFYTHYPKNTNVLSARVIEINALQKAVHLGLTNRMSRLIDREQSLVANTNAPAELRYELRIDLLGRDMDARIKGGANPLLEREKVGRALLKEFPDAPLGYELLLEVALSSDLAKMQELGQLMADSKGPRELAAIGTSLLNQLKIVGKPLPVEFTADGRQINALTLSNKVTLVDFWGTWCPICMDAMPELKKLYTQYHTNGFEIVGVNFDEDTNRAQAFLTQSGLPWPQYYGGYGDSNKYGREYGTALPYVWLVDKKGIVRDIHGRQDTEAKIQKLLAE
jgi:thiol-disulfide isomerase/thioredoxin